MAKFERSEVEVQEKKKEGKGSTNFPFTEFSKYNRIYNLSKLKREKNSDENLVERNCCSFWSATKVHIVSRWLMPAALIDIVDVSFLYVQINFKMKKKKTVSNENRKEKMNNVQNK